MVNAALAIAACIIAQATSPADAHRKANAMALLTTLALLVVLVALVVWILHWGRRLKQHDRWRDEHGERPADADPWVVSARRLDPPPDDDTPRRDEGST